MKTKPVMIWGKPAMLYTLLVTAVCCLAMMACASNSAIATDSETASSGTDSTTSVPTATAPAMKPAAPVPTPAPAAVAPAPKPVTPVPVQLPTLWTATGVSLWYNGHPVALPAEMTKYVVFGRDEGTRIVLEVPEIQFTLSGAYSFVSASMVKVSAIEYKNVPPLVTELALAMEKQLGGKLPDSFYFKVGLEGLKVSVDAKALGYELASTWVPGSVVALQSLRQTGKAIQRK